ncbi:MAG: hypothetical protein HY272_12300 [Gammaproteobacteria bacterium]|nr:hypothetical protein [Gammaproteobacteria bacterium]
MSKHNTNSIIAASITLFAGLLMPAAAQADQYHYINIPAGSRAADLGGAYTAVSDDPTGMLYNPAGIVYSPGSNLSASMNAYQTSKTTYKNVLGGIYNWERSSSTLLPNFFGVVQPLGKGVLGFSYAMPNSTIEDQDQSFTDIATSLGIAKEYIINFNNEDKTYLIGPSYAIELSKNLSFGATFYFQYRHQQRISNIITLYNGDRLWNNDYFQQEEYSLLPILGMTWSPLDKWSFGATLSKPNIIGSDITRYQTCLGANGAASNALCSPNNIVNHSIVASDKKYPYPLKATLGAAWFANDALLLSADLIYHNAIGSLDEKRESTVNLALGGEYYLSPHWAVRGGLFTDYASTPDLQPNFTAYNQPEHIDLFGLSASITHFTRNSSLTFGMTHSQGNGKAQIISGNTTLQDAALQNLSIYLAASYSY